MLKEADAVGAKVAALFSRGEARDYLDVHGILSSGRYDMAVLERLASLADPGFDQAVFAEALAAVARFPDAEFARYGVQEDEVVQVREMMRQWSVAVDQRLTAEHSRQGNDRRLDPQEPPELGPEL